MNITHATTEQIKGDRLQVIFNRQKELMEKYHHIEKRSGLLQTDSCPVNLDDKAGQARIKDFAWRLTEELGEALDAKQSNNTEHFVEELIDGLHFLTELTILAGKDYDTVMDFESLPSKGDNLRKLHIEGAEYFYHQGSSFSQTLTSFIREIGMLCNCLKNKPWKQSHMRTDIDLFYHRLRKVWISYFAILFAAGMSHADVADIYLKKSQVNKFRQRSNY